MWLLFTIWSTLLKAYNGSRGLIIVPNHHVLQITVKCTRIVVGQCTDRSPWDWMCSHLPLWTPNHYFTGKSILLSLGYLLLTVNVVHYSFGSLGANSLEICDRSHHSIRLRSQVNCRMPPQSKRRGIMCLIPAISVEFLGSFVIA